MNLTFLPSLESLTLHLACHSSSANGTGANCRSSSIRFGNTASIRRLRSTCTWRNSRITLTHVVAFMRQGHFHWLGICIQVNRQALAQSLVLACRKRTGVLASPSPQACSQGPHKRQGLSNVQLRKALRLDEQSGWPGWKCVS
jgi:hypothetical protein